MATDKPQTEEEVAGVKERDANMKKQYDDRVIDKKTGLLVDNFKYEDENTIDDKGKTVSKKVFKGGYRVFLND